MLLGVSPIGDMRDIGMPGRSVPVHRGRMPLDDDDDDDIDADFRPGGYGGNARSGNIGNMAGFGGSVGPVGGDMERMAGGGMDGGGIMGGMMMNRMAGMTTGGLMAGGGGGFDRRGLPGGNFDGLSRLAVNMGQMNVMRGDLRELGGLDGDTRRAWGGMERGRGADRRPEFGDRPSGPRSMRDMSPGRQFKSGSCGTVVLVSNMNQEVCNAHADRCSCFFATIPAMTMSHSVRCNCLCFWMLIHILNS